MTKFLALAVLLTAARLAFADGPIGVKEVKFQTPSRESVFVPRGESSCGDLNGDEVDWYLGRKDIANPIEDDAKMGPIRNQGRTQWCYAFASADIVTEALNGQRVSALGIAQQYYRHSFSDLQLAQNLVGSRDGGFIREAVLSAQQQPVCTDSQFQDRWDVLLVDAAGILKQNCEAPQADLSGLTPYARHVQNYPGGHELFADLDRQLAAGRSVGVQYNVYSTLGMQPQHFTLWPDSLANHASTIVARYYDRGAKSCKYIIRGTWGEYCETDNCKDGYYDVAEKNLNIGLNGISWVIPADAGYVEPAGSLSDNQ